MLWLAAVLPGLVIWAAVLLLPSQPWRTRERLDSVRPGGSFPDDVTALMPARNEAEVLADSLDALISDGARHIVVVDDESTDDTAAIAARYADRGVRVVSGAPLPPGWAGKLWALEQGFPEVRTPLVLLLDADIRLAPGLAATMRDGLRSRGVALLSLMVMLRTRTLWERLLMPPFVYFFKLLYPFRDANTPGHRTAAAAGGCLMIERRALRSIGGFAAMRDALIDDCTLARRVKDAGLSTWVGLTHSAFSLRAYPRLADVWNLVARSAFTQLRYSPVLLLLCTVLMAAAFWTPLAGLAAPPGLARIVAVTALLLMLAAYTPVLRFYRLSLFWLPTLPLAATLYLAMTWTSAWRYWRGARSQWKGRTYARSTVS